MSKINLSVLVPKYENILDKVGEAEVLLFSQKVQAFWVKSGASPEQKSAFLTLRREIVELRAKLENARLSDIAKRLEKLEPDLKAGIENLEEEIKDLDNIINFLNIINQLTGILSQVFLLA